MINLKSFVQKYLYLYKIYLNVIPHVFSLREFYCFKAKLRRHDLRYELDKRKKGVAALTGHVVDVVQVHSQSIM